MQCAAPFWGLWVLSSISTFFTSTQKYKEYINKCIHVYINYTKMCTYFYVVFVFMCIESGWVYALKCVVSLRFFRSSAWSSYWPEKENMSFLPYLIISVVSEWSWSEALTAFSNGRLLQGAGQRLSFVRSDLPPPLLLSFPSSQLYLSLYPHCFFCLKTKTTIFFFLTEWGS